MADTRTSTAVDAYLAGLRAELADLPRADVDDIMDDVGPHVAEVADELGRDAGDEASTADVAAKLHERLGTPQQHAAELRAAAGYPPRAVAGEAAKPSLGAPRLALGLLIAACLLPLVGLAEDTDGLFVAMFVSGVLALVSLLLATRGPRGVADVAALPEVRRVTDHAPGGVVREYALLLQPAWWFVRAGIAAMLLVATIGVFDSGLFTIAVLTLVFAIGSIWVGRRSRADRRWLWAVLPLNVFAVVALAFLPLSGYSGGWYGYGPYGSGSAAVIYEQQPRFGNVYPFDANGRPLDGVYLYDENGQPISGESYRSECSPADTGGTPQPANRYPLPEYEYVVTPNGEGRCVERTVTAPSPDVPTASARPSSTPTGTPTGSVAPTTEAPAGSGAPVTTAPPPTT